MDVHSYQRVVERELEKVEKDERLTERDKLAIKKYYKELLARGISFGRIMKYLQTIRKLYHLLGKSFEEADKQDFLELVAKIERNPEWTDWTKHDFKVILRRYYRWLRGLSDEDPFPEEVRWIKINVRNVNNKLPKDILTQGEIKKLAQTAYTTRDKAFVLTLYESGCRIGEFLNLKIRDLEFDQYGCVIHVSGKTGDRRVRLVASSLALSRWLEEHPNKNDPNAYVWVNLKNKRGDKPVSYGFVCRLLKELAGKAGINKPVNPHAFRHARATHLANKLTEAQMKEFFGWTQSSKMASVYVHLSGRDVDSAILNLYGIKQRERKREEITPNPCPKCGEVNDSTCMFCKKCGSPLDEGKYLKMERFEDLLIEFFKVLGDMFPEAKEKFVEIAKKRGLLDLFLQ